MSIDSQAMIGIGMTCIGSIMDAFGYVIQKKGHMAVIELNEIAEIEDDDNPKVHTFWSNKTWLSGFATCIVGSILNALALKFAAQSVANAILVTKFLGETFDSQKLIGIILVILGSVCAVIFGPSGSSETYTVSILKNNWVNTEFLIFFSVLSGLTLLDYCMVKVYETRNRRATVKKHKEENPLDEVEEDEDTVVMEIIYGGKFLMPSYTWLAAYYGSVNMLFMKNLTTMATGGAASFVDEWYFYLTVVVVIAVNVGLEIFRQKALLYFDASFVVPLFQVSLILGSSIMGAVFFNEFSTLSPTYLVLFGLSIGITLLGVAILAYDVGAVYHEMLHKVGISKGEALTPQEKARNAFQKKRSVGSTSLKGIEVLEQKMKRQQTMMNPMSMRGFVDFNMIKGTTKKIRNRTPRFGAMKSDGARSMPEWQRASVPNISAAMSVPVRSKQHGKSATEPTILSLNGSSTTSTNSTNGTNGHFVEVHMHSAGAMGPTSARSLPMEDIPEERTTTENFSNSKSSPDLRAVESVASQSPQSVESGDRILDIGSTEFIEPDASNGASTKENTPDIVYKD